MAKAQWVREMSIWKFIGIILLIFLSLFLVDKYVITSWSGYKTWLVIMALLCGIFFITTTYKAFIKYKRSKNLKVLLKRVGGYSAICLFTFLILGALFVRKINYLYLHQYGIKIRMEIISKEIKTYRRSSYTDYTLSSGDPSIRANCVFRDVICNEDFSK